VPRALQLVGDSAFREAGLEARFEAFLPGEDPRELARRALKVSPPVIVAAGGDGTVSAVADVVRGTASALGVVPVGTMNHFAKDAGIPLEAAAALSDTKPDIIVFHCTANSMENGFAGEAALVETIVSASGCPAITTAQAIRQALARCGIQKLVLISPYVKETNDHEVKYLTEAGFTVLHELGLGLEGEAYPTVTPQQWIDIVKANTREGADGYFLSCTNTRMIEAIADLERDLRKPVINSNQATLWTCFHKLEISPKIDNLGCLFQKN
jgi:maleate isomerase